MPLDMVDEEEGEIERLSMECAMLVCELEGRMIDTGLVVVDDVGGCCGGGGVDGWWRGGGGGGGGDSEPYRVGDE